MQIDHIGYVVKKIDRAILDFKKLGYCFGEVVDDTDRNVMIAFGEKDRYRIELVAPKGEGESPVDSYLTKIGPMPYHICYKSAEFDKDLEQLKSEGFKEFIKPQKAVAFGYKRVEFLMKLSIGMIEIVEE